jgi:hypothetical protein
MKLSFKICITVPITVAILGIQVNSSETINSCLNFEPDSVSIEGIAYSKVFPGPPNYEDTSKGDKFEKQWIIKLDKNICVNGSRKDDPNIESERNVKLVQLVVLEKEQRDALKKTRGSKIRVKGVLYHAYDAHHRTRILIKVKNIEKA